MIVSVSFAFLVTTSLLLTMNQLFCVEAVPSLTVFATLSGWHVVASSASVPPVPTPLMILLMRVEYESLEDHSARMASRAAMLDRVAVVAGRTADQDVVAVARDLIGPAGADQDIVAGTGVGQGVRARSADQDIVARSRGGQRAAIPEPPKRMASTVPAAVRFVVPVKPLAATMAVG